jgi:siroheme synthase-like protein
MMLDVSERLIVIIGGGKVAVRKASGVVECGARRVRVVAPRVDAAMPAGVERIAESYRPEHLDGAGLVFAATDSPVVNEQVVRDARGRCVLVCRADSDDQNPGDFATPARMDRGALVVTVSTAGSPALAARIRDGIAQRLDPRWPAMADALQELRPMILRRLADDPKQRTEALRRLASDQAMDTLSKSGIDGLKRWLGEQFPQLAG